MTTHGSGSPDNPYYLACSSLLCSLLQTLYTERCPGIVQVLEIRNAIQEDRAVQVCILNYKKDGEAFWNHFHLAPILDSTGVVEYYIGAQPSLALDSYFDISIVPCERQIGCSDDRARTFLLSNPCMMMTL